MLRARHAGKANESGRSSDSSRVRHPSRFRHPLALLLERGVISPVVELTENLPYIGRLVVDSSPSFPNIQNLEAPRSYRRLSAATSKDDRVFSRRYLTPP